MAPTTVADLVELIAAGLLQGITSPYTWATAALAVVLVVACERAENRSSR